jgi:hypothetical protein
MARVKVSRELALKAFVTSLMETFDTKTFTRANVEEIGKTNGIGQTLFASQGQGYGKMTRIGQGQYVIPDSWMSGKAPWEGVTEVVPVAKAEKAPKAPKDKDVTPKVKKSKKSVEPEAVEVAETITSSVKKNVDKMNAKRAMTKKELFEKAKAEIAKKKKVNTEVASEASAESAE